MSNETVLTVIDVTGTQDYIFTSNRLRESVGASRIVAQATSWWIFDVLNGEFSNNTNIDSMKTSSNPKSPFEALQNRAIESGLDAEVIYVGGGNALILFENLEKAKQFTKAYTKKLLRAAPGLDVVVAHSGKFDIKAETEKDGNGNDALPIRLHLEEAMKKITEKKSYRKISAPVLGLAVSAQCVSTGGIASFDPKDEASGRSVERYETLEDKYGNNYVSAEIWKKLNTVDEANERLERELFASVEFNEEVKRKLGGDADKLGVPLAFDNLGRTEGETSLIAVVHTDGNGMGKRVKDFSERSDFDTNRKWITAMRGFSEEINNANLIALQKTVEFLASRLDKDKKTGEVVLKSENDKDFVLGERHIFKRDENRQKDIICYPFRPIIFGGEDVAFVCDARIALDLTAFYLKELEKIKLESDGKPIYGRAGIAIVKSHYPFRRAYDLAEQLAKSAKERIREVESSQGAGDVLAMDWHIAFTGLAGTIEAIREREFVAGDGKLNMRPVSLCKTKDRSDWQTWENFVSLTRQFQADFEKSRNKLKALREVLREGRNEVAQFLALNKKTFEDGKLPGAGAGDWDILQKEGWENGRCGYFDALEMMDLYYPLNREAVTKCGEKTQNSEDITE